MAGGDPWRGPCEGDAGGTPVASDGSGVGDAGVIAGGGGIDDSFVALDFGS